MATPFAAENLRAGQIQLESTLRLTEPSQATSSSASYTSLKAGSSGKLVSKPTTEDKGTTRTDKPAFLDTYAAEEVIEGAS